MRLGSCVAIELAVGAGLVAAIAVGGVTGARALEAAGTTAHAATVVEPPPPVRLPERGELGLVPSELTVFHGVSDELLVEPLRDGAIERVKVNKGGSSISLRIDFDNGARAAFKPRQINWQTMPRKEIAAYRINRMLGLSSVAPAIGRAFVYDELVAALAPEHAFHRPRLDEEVLREDGDRVVGELSWWIPVIDHPTVDGYRIDSLDGVVTWKRYLTAGEPIARENWRMMAQVSDMVLFDFLINNPDRWSGGNVRCSEDGAVLYFMDNTLAFLPQDDGTLKTRTYLERVQKFSRSLVRAVRELDERELREALAEERGPFEVLLQDDEIEALMARRAHLLRYIDGLIATYGEDDVLVFP